MTKRERTVRHADHGMTEQVASLYGPGTVHTVNSTGDITPLPTYEQLNDPLGNNNSHISRRGTSVAMQQAVQPPQTEIQ